METKPAAPLEATSTPKAVQQLRWLLRFWALAFVVTGLLFLVIPNWVIEQFNAVGSHLGSMPLPTSSPAHASLWLGLALAYMVMVTALAWTAQRGSAIRPEPVHMLVLAKASSSALSLLFFVASVHAFALAVNFAIDGFIAAFTLVMLRRAT